jgi:hypothetical protein
MSNVRTEMIRRLRARGSERTPRQAELLKTCEQADALSRMHDRRVRREHERG